MGTCRASALSEQYFGPTSTSLRTAKPLLYEKGLPPPSITCGRCEGSLSLAPVWFLQLFFV